MPDLSTKDVIVRIFNLYLYNEDMLDENNDIDIIQKVTVQSKKI